METLITFSSIGTQWWINIYDELSDSQKVLLDTKIESIAKEFEDNYSRFNTTSYVARLNRGENLSEVPEELNEMLDIAEKVKQITDGHFDINIGATIENYGYDSEYSFIEKEGSNNSIDLGGIGKGYLIDKIKNFLLSIEIKSFFINAGGDIYSTSNFGEQIEFALQNPINKDEVIGKIKIKDASIAASSPLLRKWKTQNTNKHVHHLIDFKTKKPIEDIVGVFTLADTALNADLGSTAIFVSPQDLHKQIAEFLHCEYLIVYKDLTFKKSENYPAELNE